MERTLKNISDFLLQHSNIVSNPGLLHGKMGLAVFFFNYARCTGNIFYEEQAITLIYQIQELILQQQNINYADGLTGIGVGIEYLSQIGLLDIDTNEILEDFDGRIRQEIMYGQKINNTLFNGFCGLGQYLLYRLNCPQKRTDEFRLLANQELMVFFVNIMENGDFPQYSDLPDVLSFLCKLYLLDICNPKIDRYVDKILPKLSIDDFDHEMLPAFTLPLLRISSIRPKISYFTYDLIHRVLQTVEQNNIHLENRTMDVTNRLLWLLHCKRLIAQTGVCMDSVDRFDVLIRKLLEQTNQIMQFEKENLSLKGYAGVGLVMMTITGQCDDAWLDLLG